MNLHNLSIKQESKNIHRVINNDTGLTVTVAVNELIPYVGNADLAVPPSQRTYTVWCGDWVIGDVRRLEKAIGVAIAHLDLHR